MARFKIENRLFNTVNTVICETEEDVRDYIENDFGLWDAYDDSLNEMGDIEIGCLSYSPSEVLKRVDPIAYNCGYDDWLDGIMSDLVYDLERMDVGDEMDVWQVNAGMVIFCIEDEDEEDDEDEDEEV